VNFVGHAVVAARVAPGDGAFVLGAILPDLWSMTGVRADADALPDEVVAGVRCHHAADAAFHGHAAFIGLMRALRADLIAAGVARGPARAAAHVGIELALDGLLLDRPSAREAMAAALDARDGVRAAVPAGDRPRWDALLTRMAGGLGDRPYRDPAPVVQRVLGRRPRLALPDENVPLLAARLDAARPAVAAAEPALVDSAVEASVLA
jgi:hypothetical protein